MAKNTVIRMAKGFSRYIPTNFKPNVGRGQRDDLAAAIGEGWLEWRAGKHLLIARRASWVE